MVFEFELFCNACNWRLQVAILMFWAILNLWTRTAALYEASLVKHWTKIRLIFWNEWFGDIFLIHLFHHKQMWHVFGIFWARMNDDFWQLSDFENQTLPNVSFCSSCLVTINTRLGSKACSSAPTGNVKYGTNLKWSR